VAKSDRKPIIKVESVWSVKVNGGTVLLVEKGDKIKKGQPIAKKQKKLFEKINVSAQLSLDPKIILKGLLVKNGDQVNKGDCLVSVKSFPFKIKKFFSPVSGLFESFSDLTGEIKIVIGKEEEQIVSPVIGEVIEAEKERLKVKFNAYRIAGEAVGRGRGWGELVMIAKEESSLAENVEDKILFIDKLTSLHIKKGIVLGVKGFLSFEISNEIKDLEKPALLFKMEKEAIKSKLVELLGSSALLDSTSGQLLICID